MEPVNLFVEPFLCGTFLEPGAKYRVELLCTKILGMLLSNVNGGYCGRPCGQMATVQSASSFVTVWNMNSQAKVRSNRSSVCLEGCTD